VITPIHSFESHFAFDLQLSQPGPLALSDFAGEDELLL